MITNLDAHLAVPIDDAADLTDTPDLLAEVLRHATSPEQPRTVTR